MRGTIRAFSVAAMLIIYAMLVIDAAFAFGGQSAITNQQPAIQPHDRPRVQAPALGFAARETGETKAAVQAPPPYRQRSEAAALIWMITSRDIHRALAADPVQIAAAGSADPEVLCRIAEGEIGRKGVGRYLDVLLPCSRAQQYAERLRLASPARWYWTEPALELRAAAKRTVSSLAFVELETEPPPAGQIADAGVDPEKRRQPASQIGGGLVLVRAPELGFPGLGWGGSVNLSVNLPANFTITEAAEFVSERKSTETKGLTKSSLTGVQYHFPGGFFARGAFFAGRHVSQNETITRAHFGGGWQLLADETWLPRLSVTGVGFVPVSDSHGLHGVKLSATSCYTLVWALAACGDASLAYSRGHDFGQPDKTFSGVSYAGGVRLVLNLSALMGQ